MKTMNNFILLTGVTPNSLSTLNQPELAILLSLITGTLSFMLFVGLTLFVIQIIARWRIFNKMGEPGYKSIIPFYNEYIMFKRVYNGKAYFIYLLSQLVGAFLLGMWEGFNKMGPATKEVGLAPLALLCGVATIVLSIITLIIYIKYVRRLSRSFGHGDLFAVGLFLLDFVFELIIAFGKSEYIGNQSHTFNKNHSPSNDNINNDSSTQ